MARPSAPQTAAPAPPRQRRILLRAAWRWALLGLVSMGLVGAAALYTLAGSEPGSAWLLGRIPGLKVQGLQGRLLGPTLRAGQIDWVATDARLRVRIDQPRIEGLAWRFWLGPGVWAALRAASFSATRIEIDTVASDTAPAAPASLRSPLHLSIARVDIGTLRVGRLPQLDALQGAVTIDAVQHRFEGLRTRLAQVQLAGSARIASDAPFAIEAQLDAQAAADGDRPAWQAGLRAGGVLQALTLQATLRGEAPAGASTGREVATFDARAELHPLRAWPLGRLSLSTQALDLAALHPAAPRTRLSGQAQVDSGGLDRPALVQAELTNATPGRLGDGRLPLRRVQLTLQARPDRPHDLTIERADLQFADGPQDAGRFSGSGRWLADRLTLAGRIEQLRPSLIDTRAPAMSLGGSLQLALSGLPSLAPAATAATPAPPAQVVRSEFSARLDGRFDARPQPVAVEIAGRADAQQLQLTRAELRAGEARAELTLDLQRSAAGGVALRSRGSLTGFDPAHWVPGEEGSAWRRGPHRLNGRWLADLQWGAVPTTTSVPQRLGTLQGQGWIELDDSRLAGVALAGRLDLAHDNTAPAAEAARLQGELRLGGNRIQFAGRGQPQGSGAGDRLRFDIDAPALAALAPLAALHPQTAQWAPRTGRAAGHIELRGRWPELHTEGEATFDDLGAGTLTLKQARTRWRVDLAAGVARRDAALWLQLEAIDATYGVLRLARLRAAVDGTRAGHRIQLDLASPVRPPAALERSLGLASRAGTLAQLQGSGSWIAGPGGGFGWRGRVDRLWAGGWDGDRGTAPTAWAADAAAAEATGYWVDAREMQAEVRFDPDGRLHAVDTDAGSARLAGGVPLRWQEIRWRAAAAPGGRDEFSLRLEAGPVRVAPFLQRAQPNVRWGGALRMAARAEVRAGDRFEADIALQRLDGDLHVIEGGTELPLGLSEAAAALQARNGEWQFTPLIVGSQVGTVTGALTARADPRARWPGSGARLSGALHAAVPQLAVWGSWLPPGWRLDGELSATARVDGRVGAPNYTGELSADRVSLRNLLQGVEVRDGRLRMELQGETARITELTLRGGDGRVSATGSASFGAEPQARLQAEADKFLVLGRVDRRLVGSGRATLSLARERLQLDGKLSIDSAFFDLGARDAPSLDEDVIVLRRQTAEAAAENIRPVAPQRLRNAQVALELDLGPALRLRGRGLDTGLRGQLKLSTPGGRLAINGRVQTHAGTYAAYGQKLEIERGGVDFRGPPDAPLLDIVALRPNLDLRVGVAITGTAQNPRIRLFSDPEMSETEKLSWLVLGRGSDGLGRTDTALLQRAAVALLAGEGDAPTDALLRAIGIDDLSVRQTDGDTRDTIVSLGKQLSRRWYVGYERSVNATAGTWQLVYRIAQRFTLRAQSGLENSLDLIWTWRFN